MKPGATRRRPWSLARLWRTNRAALCVYCALESSGKTSVTTPTRESLAKLTGIARKKSISAALTALEQAGWIERVHVPVVDGAHRATLLRVILKHKGRVLPLEERRSPRANREEPALPSMPQQAPASVDQSSPVESDTQDIVTEPFLPQDPKTGVSLPVALSLARQRRDEAEIARLEALLNPESPKTNEAEVHA